MMRQPVIRPLVVIAVLTVGRLHLDPTRGEGRAVEIHRKAIEESLLHVADVGRTRGRLVLTVREPADETLAEAEDC